MRTVAIIDGHLTADEQLATVLYARLAATLQGSGVMCPIYISYSYNKVTRYQLTRSLTD